MSLKSDHIIQRSSSIILTQLDHGVGLFTSSLIYQSNRL